MIISNKSNPIPHSNNLNLVICHFLHQFWTCYALFMVAELCSYLVICEFVHQFWTVMLFCIMEWSRFICCLQNISIFILVWFITRLECWIFTKFIILNCGDITIDVLNIILVLGKHLRLFKTSLWKFHNLWQPCTLIFFWKIVQFFDCL